MVQMVETRLAETTRADAARAVAAAVAAAVEAAALAATRGCRRRWQRRWQRLVATAVVGGAEARVLPLLTNPSKSKVLPLLTYS